MHFQSNPKLTFSNGIFRESRESWSDPLDPCNVCTCRLINYISDDNNGNNNENKKNKYGGQGKNTIEGGSYNDVKMGKNEVFCMRMTLVECYMRISGAFSMRFSPLRLTG